MAIEMLNRNNFDVKVLENKMPVIVDFYADWCGSCRAMTPVIEELHQEYGEKITVARVNVDEEPSLAAKYQIRGIPTIAFFCDGAMVEQLVGAVPKERITSRLKSLKLLS